MQLELKQQMLGRALLDERRLELIRVDEAVEQHAHRQDDSPAKGIAWDYVFVI
jgi:hypothetical protein